jgi:hypothetical protein
MVRETLARLPQEMPLRQLRLIKINNKIVHSGVAAKPEVVCKLLKELIGKGKFES